MKKAHSGRLKGLIWGWGEGGTLGGVRGQLKGGIEGTVVRYGVVVWGVDAVGKASDFSVRFGMIQSAL